VNPRPAIEAALVLALLAALAGQLAWGIASDGMTNDEVLYISALMEEWGLVTQRVHMTDSSSAIVHASRLGLGGLRHMEVRYLWVQNEVRNGRVTIKKIPGSTNATDLAATLTFKAGGGIQIYVNPLVQNVFNNHAVITVDTSVYTNRDRPDNLAPFNPFTYKPKECPQHTTCNLADGYNWQKGENFGKPMQPSDYQTPRTFMLNVGVRF